MNQTTPAPANQGGKPRPKTALTVEQFHALKSLFETRRFENVLYADQLVGCLCEQVHSAFFDNLTAYIRGVEKFTVIKEYALQGLAQAAGVLYQVERFKETFEALADLIEEYTRADFDEDYKNRGAFTNNQQHP